MAPLFCRHFQEEFLDTLMLGPVGAVLIEAHGLLFFLDGKADDGIDGAARNGRHSSLGLHQNRVIVGLSTE